MSQSDLEDLFLVECRISALNKELKDLKITREAMLAGIVSRKITVQGRFVLTPKVREIRVPIIPKFRELLGDQFDSMIKIKLKESEDLLTKEVVDSACRFVPQVSYFVQDTSAIKNTPEDRIS